MPNSSAMKSLERGRQRDDEIGLVLAGGRGGRGARRRARFRRVPGARTYRVAALAARFARQRGARCHQPVVQLRIALPERLDEGAVETDQSVAPIEVLEFEPKPECKALQSSRAGHPQVHQATRNRSMTAAGIGIPFNFVGSSRSRPTQTRVSLPSTTSSPSIEIR